VAPPEKTGASRFGGISAEGRGATYFGAALRWTTRTFSAIALVTTMSQLNFAAVEAAGPWKQLSPIPDSEGFAGSFAGVSGDALIFAGGANIVGEKWGEKFTKKWSDHIYVLDRPDGAWKRAGKLDAPLGYGVSVTAGDALICIGGSNEGGHTDDVFALRLRDGEVAIERNLPKLPRPMANACGALVGTTIYVAGGIESPGSTAALHTFLALDLTEPKPAWQELPGWPGAERMLGVAGASGDYFYLFSGASLSPGPDGKPVRKFLRDAYRYSPHGGWSKLQDLPRAAVAAASPAYECGPRETLAVISGDDGLNVEFQPLREHPGFPREILGYNTPGNRWQRLGDVPFSRATVPAVVWRKMIVIPNGEVRPRVRTNEVWALEF
jgi:N-acetylneuraminic acid mutarotase